MKCLLNILVGRFYNINKPRLPCSVISTSGRDLELSVKKISPAGRDDTYIFHCCPVNFAEMSTALTLSG